MSFSDMTGKGGNGNESLGRARLAKVQRFFARNTTYLRKDFNLRIRAEIVNSLVGSLCGSKVLDIGCGDGSISRQFLNNGNHVVRLDISPDMLELAKASTPDRGAFECRHINANLLDHALPERFDLVLCLGVLAHVPSVDGAFQRIRAQLQNNGRCIIQWSDHQRLVGKLMTTYGSLGEWAKGTYGYDLNKLNTTDVIHTAKSHGLFPVSLIRYSLMLPGMGRLPNNLLYRFQKMTMTNNLLRALSTDVVGLFSTSPLSSTEGADPLARTIGS